MHNTRVNVSTSLWALANVFSAYFLKMIKSETHFLTVVRNHSCDCSTDVKNNMMGFFVLLLLQLAREQVSSSNRAIV